MSSSTGSSPSCSTARTDRHATCTMTAMTGTPLAAAAIARLEAEGVDTVIGTVVNPAGLTLAKTVPIRRTNTFADPGLGASPSWHAFAVDQNGIAFTRDVGVVGDQRLRIDLSGTAHDRRRVGVGARRLFRAGRHARRGVRAGHPEPDPGRAHRGRHRGGDRPRDRIPAGRPGRRPVAVDAVGAIRPRRRARARSVRAGRHRVRPRPPVSRSSSSTPSTVPTSSSSPCRRSLRWPPRTRWC